MGDSSANNAGTSQPPLDAWAQQWIEQQRALLEQAAQSGAKQSGAKQAAGAEAGTGFEQINLLGGQWAELGKSYLAGLAQLTQGLGQGAGVGGSEQAGGTAHSSAAPGEMLDHWRAAWSNAMSQASAPGGWTDLLNRTPPLGLFREQTEAWRAVAAARGDMERLERELGAVLRRVQAEALTMLEAKVKERADGDKPIQGFRELYDLWVDCSEQVFNTVAHSSAYGHLQGELGNASMRLRARVQKVIEQGLKQFDLPTRSEINSLHQQVRQLKQKIAALESSTAGESQSAPPPAKPAPRKKPSAAKRPAKTAARPARKRSR